MSMIGELNYFLGLPIKQFQHDTFLCQSKYCLELLKKFDMENCKETFTPIATACSLDMDENGKVMIKPNSEVFLVHFYI